MGDDIKPGDLVWYDGECLCNSACVKGWYEQGLSQRPRDFEYSLDDALDYLTYKIVYQKLNEHDQVQQKAANVEIKRPQAVILELEDLPDTHTAIAEYINKLESSNGVYMKQADSRYRQIKKMYTEVRDYRAALARIAGLSSEKQDQCSNIALNALDIYDYG